jgi:hypothetical protein
MSAWTRDLITSLIGLWIVIGVYIDGWAHRHLNGLIEDFFTPWHASFYSGLAAFAAWTGLIMLRIRRPGEPAIQTFRRLPVGYRGGAIGVAIFTAGGAADMLWHTLLGVEVSIDALLSPPHLLLLAGVLLMGTTAWRSQRVLSPVATLPELISLASVTAISAFFLNFLSPFASAAPVLPFEFPNEFPVALWVGTLLVTTVIVFIPTLWQVRDKRHRVGTLAAFTFAAGLGTSIGMSLGWSLKLLLATVAAATIGALAGDLMLARLPWRQWRYGLPVVAFAASLTIWSAHLLALALTAGVTWPIQLWGGTLLFAAGTAAALASLTHQGVPAGKPPVSQPRRAGSERVDELDHAG